MGGELWLRFKSPKEAKRAEAFMAPLNNNVGIDNSWGCWLEWVSPTKLEIGYSFLALCSAAADFVQREICRRFDVRQIGATAFGWYPEKDWQSTDPKGAPACYPGYSDWPTWAKDYKPEWSGHLPKWVLYPDNEALFEKIRADTLRDLRKVEAFVEAKFKELDG